MKKISIAISFFLLINEANAQAWQLLDIPTSNDIRSSSFVNDSVGWIGFENASYITTLYHTSDRGDSWDAVGVPGAGTGTSSVRVH